MSKLYYQYYFHRVPYVGNDVRAEGRICNTKEDGIKIVLDALALNEEVAGGIVYRKDEKGNVIVLVVIYPNLVIPVPSKDKMLYLIKAEIDGEEDSRIDTVEECEEEARDEFNCLLREYASQGLKGTLKLYEATETESEIIEDELLAYVEI